MSDSEPDTTTDVLVVGAGPTGLLLAGDLAAAGVRTVLVERRAAGVSNLTRAFAVHARSLEVMDARGLADELVATGTPVDRLRFFREFTLRMSALRTRTRFPFVLITPQYEVERLLERRARDAGVEFRYGTRLVGLEQSAGGVTARAEGADGAPVELRARYAVGADGVRSTVREALGMPFPGHAVIRSMVLADVRLTDPPDSPISGNEGDDAVALVVPFGDGWHRIIAWDAHSTAEPDDPLDLAEVRDVTRRALGFDPGVGEARWLSRLRSDERQVPAYRRGRVLLAGDAAHVHSPAGGQGMNTGLQDAANLSWKLAAVVRGRAPDPEGLLDSYHAERYPVGRMVIRSSGLLIRVVMADSRARRAVRRLAARALTVLPPAMGQAVGQVSGVGISYRRPRGSHPLTGKRAPDLRLTEGRLYELLRQGRFVLVAPPGHTPPDAPAPADALRAHWAGEQRRSLLIRPDGYIAWAANRE
ncbi:FAD-dependent monooxygenase [Streptomyces yaizuensis]|uniref:FAD-dependent monooxygenase n=1 Tax=Streptomyces yaizuensis TaxID=2989713 RepID=A0ABQ5P4B1_9ACTN|nr:FAD-dependent monooxygenase [Streptomyces sp. YSPA8]GLF97427.1 FAD-dependent monooxygenase [Streptomyces sp. YSPA8]